MRTNRHLCNIALLVTATPSSSLPAHGKGAAPKRGPFRATMLCASVRCLAMPLPFGLPRCAAILLHRIAGLTRSAVSVESEDWRLIGCVALRVGLHEGDGQLDPLGIKEVGNAVTNVASHLTVQLLK